MNHPKIVIIIILFAGILIAGCKPENTGILINVYPDSVLADVSHHPIGINVDYFMDDDNYLKPARRTADALKAMGAKYLRYPGGNKSDLYLFSVPPYEIAKPKLARTGKGAVEYERVIKGDKEYKYDVLDFDEFIAMCREVGAEPVITVAADEYLADYPEGCTWTDREGLIRNAVEWVRYANIKKKYNVKYWLIGNECWHENNPNSTAEIYARDVVDFSKAMKAVDTSIYIIPNGNSVEFCETVLKIAGDYIDYFCISNYPIYEYKSGYATYRDTLQDMMHPVDRALTAIANTGLKNKIKLIITEYGPFDWGDIWPMINDMGHALFNFELAGKQLLVPEIEFSQFWNTRWINNDSIENSVYDALDKDGNFNADGYTLMIWGNFLGDKMVKTTSTLHIRSFASYSPEEKILYVYIMNMMENPEYVTLDIGQNKISSVIQAWNLAGNGADDCNPVWQEYSGLTDPLDFEVKGTSITVIKYQLKI
jgi:alpha-L-arabinofuranosidase